MRKLFGLLTSLLLLASFAPLAPVAAQDLSCGSIAPARSSFVVVDNEGTPGGGSSSDTATFKFRMSRDGLEALRCAGSSAEIDFRFTNYEYREGETEINFANNDLGAYQYLTYDSNGDPILRVSGIDPNALAINETYTVQVTFRLFYAYNMGNGQPHLLSLEWAPGEWFPESYVGECDDNLLDAVDVGSNTFCHTRYDDEAIELGVHDFGY